MTCYHFVSLYRN